ncbi:MAG: aminopeptidase P family protein [Candidatus Bathyarchaeota archaeon]|nr:MAG: aminopeptidase P family protein [Candidatus Bathyarchaeota archaeon]
MNENESIKRRRKAILEEIKNRDFDTVIFINEVINQNPSNFIYMSGSWGYGEEHCSIIIDVSGQSSVIVPHWSATKIEALEAYDHVIPIKQEKGHHIRATRRTIERYYDAEKICFDLSTMSTQFALQLFKSLNLKPLDKIDISDYTYKLRAIKDEYEINQLKKAIQITEQAVIDIALLAKPGKNINELKRRLDAKMIKLGAVEFAFDSSISFSRGLPKQSNVIKYGDMLSIDVGCSVSSGYCSDMGRNIPISLDAQVKNFLDRAVDAHKEGIKFIKEGAIASDVLKESSRINQEHGFEPIIRCGHQIGLDCHDYLMPYAPNFGPIDTDKQPLLKGMTLTYEPPHIDKKKLLRTHFEDIILVGGNSPIILNQLPWNFLW